MSLLLSVRSEFIKIRRTSAFYISLIVTAIIPLIMYFEDDDLPQKDLQWTKFFNDAQQGINFLFLPLFVILVSTLLLQIEHRNNTWKQVLASPQKLANVFFAKFIILHLFILLFFVFYNTYLSISAWLTELTRPDVFKGGLDIRHLLFLNFKTWMAVLGMSAIQFWLSLRFKNFISPLAIGFILWLMAPLMIFSLNWPIYHQYPYAFSILSISRKFSDWVVGYQWLSVGYAVLFLAIGFVEFQFKKVKT